jgi:hypothetical protein
MSDWDTVPVSISTDWDVVEDHNKPATLHENSAPGSDKAVPAAAAAVAVEMRKSSLADLTNGDRDAITAHLARGLGPHQFLSRYSAAEGKMSPKANVPLPTVEEQKTPPASVVDKTEAVTPTPLSVVKPGPHRKFQIVAQKTPLPESPAAPMVKSPAAPMVESPATPITAVVDKSPTSPIRSEATIVEDSFSPSWNNAEILESSTAEVAEESEHQAPVVTIQETTESDSDTASISAVIKVERYSNHDGSESAHSYDHDQKDLDPKAHEWLPDMSDGPLPPSCPVSPVSETDSGLHASDGEDGHESYLINHCDPVPESWTVPTIVGNFASGDLFDGPCLGGVHKTVLAYYSHHFAHVWKVNKSDGDSELAHFVDNPLFAVFRQWIFGRRLSVKLPDGTVKINTHISLKTLVQLWRFGAHMQAPLFANTVADVMIVKAIKVTDVLAAADDIDAVLNMVDSKNKFRLIISHAVILNGIELNAKDYDKWPRSLIWCILTWLCMGKSTAVGTHLFAKTHTCAYHLHTPSRTCLN